MLDKIIFASYSLLFFLVPLFWTSKNYELFEFNKMMLVYGLTVIITGAWLLKIIYRKSLIFNRTPLDIPLLLFLAANVLSTIFSIDTHTSIWGYYSRANGGLLSLMSYLLLYWALVSNINKEQVFKLLKIGLISGVIISIYAILEHFGVSPSCVILHGQFNADCWVQDVQARVFATLGQPNWLAAYLGMLIFPALYFFLTIKKPLNTYYLILTTILYLAFTFTFSRGGTLGLIAGMITFLSFWLVQNPPTAFQERFWGRRPERSRRAPPQNDIMTKPLILILAIFLLINLLFGSALTGSFRLLKEIAPPPRPTIGTSTTQLEAGGTESGQIRLIVWKGALDIFKHYPIFGSGVETFAYSYYQFRPAAHNLVSEWDFLYNKAHNEYLNYLATTGAVGFASYTLVILTFISWTVLRIFNFHFLIFNEKFKFQISNLKNFDNNLSSKLLVIALLSSYISYLIQNFFGFSVVIIALFFYLFPALAFVATGSTAALHHSSSKFHFLPSIINRRPLNKAVRLAILLLTFYLLLTLVRFWLADTQFASGQQANDAGNPGRAYNYLTNAINLRGNEPFYHSELGFAAASAALALNESDATLSAELKDQAVAETEQVLAQNPNNTSYWRTAIRTYFELYGLDESFLQKTLEATDRTITLAPTDAKLYYNKAVILEQVKSNDAAIYYLQKALDLKPNYRDAYVALALVQFDGGQKEKAVENMNKALAVSPGDQEALEKLNQWGKEGIATRSANQ